MEKKFVANRYSEGNGTYQTSITTKDNGLMVRVPEFWQDTETFYSYNDIAGVCKTTPLLGLGFSSIEFNVFGRPVKAYGFTKNEVNEIAQTIELGKKELLVRIDSNIASDWITKSFGSDDFVDSLIRWLLGKPFKKL